jgi:hypothetical protein
LNNYYKKNCIIFYLALVLGYASLRLYRAFFDLCCFYSSQNGHDRSDCCALILDNCCMLWWPHTSQLPIQMILFHIYIYIYIYLCLVMFCNLVARLMIVIIIIIPLCNIPFPGFSGVSLEFSILTFLQIA